MLKNPKQWIFQSTFYQYIWISYVLYMYISKGK